MVWPEYIPLREVNLARAFVLESGAPQRVDLDVKASRSLVWGDTLEPFVSSTFLDRGNATGMPVSIFLPPTDIDEAWRDLDTNALIAVGADQHSHTYTITATFKDAAGQHPRTRVFGPFSLPSGEGAIDLLDLIPMSTEDGGTVYVPDTWDEKITEAQQAAGRSEQAAGRAEQAAQEAATEAAAAGPYAQAAGEAATRAEKAAGDADAAADRAENASRALREDPNDPGTYLILDPDAISEDPADEGTFLIGVAA